MSTLARQNTTGTLAILAYAAIALLALVGVELPLAVVTGVLVLIIAVTSLIFPRWSEGRSLLAEHPAGVAGAATTVLVWLAPLLGLSVDAASAGALIAGVTAAVSLFTPRASHPDPAAELNRSGLGR